MQPIPGFLPGESHRQKSLVGCSPWGRQSRTRLKRLSIRARERSGNTCTDLISHQSNGKASKATRGE